MDLSHWDSVHKFTRAEAAALMTGWDPNINSFSEAQNAKQVLMSRLIDEGFYTSVRQGSTIVLKAKLHPPEKDGDFFDFRSNQLPSIEWRKAIADVIAGRGPNKTHIQHPLPTKHDDEDRFLRDDLRDWISAMGIRSVYNFDGFGNDQLPDAPYQRRTSGPSDSDPLAKPAKKKTAFRKSADTLVQRKLLSIIAALADKANVDLAARGTARRIAEWTTHLRCSVDEGTVKEYIDMVPEVIGDEPEPKREKSEFGKANPN